MKNLRKYIRGQIGEQELEEVTGQLLRAKFGNEARQRWALQLKKEYGIERKPAGRPKKLYWMSAVAAAALLLAILWPAFQGILRPTYEKTAQAYLAERFPAREIRKGTQEMEVARLEAADAYIREDYQQAIALRKAAAGSSAANSSDHFYLGLCYLYLKEAQPKLAIQHLQKAREMDKGQLQQEIDWFLGLAYIQNGEPDKAREALQEIVRDKGWNAEKAEKLLREMKN